MSRKKAMVKDYYHEPKEVSRQQLVNQLNLQYQIDIDAEKNLKSKRLIKRDIIWDEKGPDTIKRSMCNMSAAYISLFYFTSYICTHEKMIITKDNNIKEPYHNIYGIPWKVFCNIVGADDHESKRILLVELKQVNGQSKVVDLGNRYAYLPPFEIHFFSKEKTEMSIQELQRSDNIKQFPIDNVNIRFLKVLYDRFIQYGNNYINYPLQWPKIVRNFCKKMPTLHTSPELIMKAFTYLNVFDNSPLNRASVNVYEMIYYADPNAIQIKNGKWYLRGNEAKALLIDTIAALQLITSDYKDKLNFTINGILFPQGPTLPDFDTLTDTDKINIILAALDATNGKLPLSITRNQKLLRNKKGP
jgi:hypothetical protein